MAKTLQEMLRELAEKYPAGAFLPIPETYRISENVHRPFVLGDVQKEIMPDEEAHQARVEMWTRAARRSSFDALEAATDRLGEPGEMPRLDWPPTNVIDSPIIPMDLRIDANAHDNPPRDFNRRVRPDSIHNGPTYKIITDAGVEILVEVKEIEILGNMVRLDATLVPTAHSEGTTPVEDSRRIEVPEPTNDT